MRSYAELAVTTNFSFLRGASHPEEFVAQAIEIGLAGIGIADRNSLAGVVRAHVYLREHKESAGDLRVITGARLVFSDGTPDIIAYPSDRAAYGRLCRLLTTGNLRAEKGDCILMFDDLLDYAEGLELIVMEHPTGLLRASTDGLDHRLARLILAAPRRVWLGAVMTYGAHMRGGLHDRIALAQKSGLPLLATNDVLMHVPERRRLADSVTCIREGVTIEAAGTRLAAHAERHLKDLQEMTRLFSEAPQAIAATTDFLARITFSLDELKYDYPLELRQGFATEQEALEAFTFEGAALRYPGGIPEPVMKAIRHELDLIREVRYAAYFLTVHDIMNFARSKKILCQGRGSAANSTVCYCLYITEVDPMKVDLLFEQFVSIDRKEPPDIDVDFEHERREIVMQYIYDHYGRDHASLTATVISYRGRSALRDVAKAFGFSEDAIGALSSTIWGWSSGGVEADEVRRVGFDPEEPRFAMMRQLTEELSGFPRHLSQHTGGFVITRSRLDEVMPIAHAAMDERWTVEWNKDDLNDLGMLKIDVLALGMLTCLHGCFDLLDQHYDQKLSIATLPAEDPAVYAMISRADTIGVFQIESRAQMSMLPRLKPNKFYDLVIEVAIVRPGPIQGDMVHPYLRRRQGIDEESYPSEELKTVLGKTLGVPLFQEQAMKIAIVAAGFTPSEADRLRRAMATFKRVGTIGNFQKKMVEGMVARKYDREFAERCFKQIEGFGSYGFPESHAASFALIVYVSAWMKCRYPDVFACALLNAQPMGFYAPAQIVRDAREHGVPVREVDINLSDWDCTLEAAAEAHETGADAARLHPRHAGMREVICGNHALRLGFRQIKGVREEDMKALVAARGRGYDSVRDLWLRTRLSPKVLETLAVADAFRSIGLDRRDGLWAVRGLNRSGDKDDLPLFAAASAGEVEPQALLPPMLLGEHVVEDYRHLRLSLKAHPIRFLRHRLAARHILQSEELTAIPQNRRITVAGLVLVRQRPGTGKGVIFMTLEDETGIANIIVWPKVFETFRPIVIGARCVAVTGKLQNEAGVIHIIAEKIEDCSAMLGLLAAGGDTLSSLARADEVRRPNGQDPREKAAERPVSATLSLFAAMPESTAKKPLAKSVLRVMPKGRSFH